jgi:predicted GTPase
MDRIYEEYFMEYRRLGGKYKTYKKYASLMDVLLTHLYDLEVEAEIYDLELEEGMVIIDNYHNLLERTRKDTKITRRETEILLDSYINCEYENDDEYIEDDVTEPTELTKYEHTEANPENC